MTQKLTIGHRMAFNTCAVFHNMQGETTNCTVQRIPNLLYNDMQTFGKNTNSNIHESFLQITKIGTHENIKKGMNIFFTMASNVFFLNTILPS